MGKNKNKDKPRMTPKKKRAVISIIAAALAALTAWTVWGNTTVGTTVIEVFSGELPAAFNGYRIAQISDLHNAELGEGNSRVIEILEREQPDLIVITGDMADSRRTDVAVASEFARKAVNIAPCYYVTGNHESRIPAEYAELEEELLACGVTVLHDQSVTLERGGETVTLIGIDDPSFAMRVGMSDLSAGMFSADTDRARDDDGFTILLSHRPELIGNYAEMNVDLVFSGHAHGGQFRLPLIGGLVAPGQGLFPKYDSGLYSVGKTQMIVSRGIGNSIIPVRLNNRPEVVVATLHCE